MNTGLLKTFLEVAKTRHFGRAADNLYLTQSAVSARINQLEALVGVPVFTRQRNNILLTPSGERLLPHAENILAAWQVALQEVGVHSDQNMQLALGGTSNLWDIFLQSLLPRLADRFPNLTLRTEINSPQELTRALIAGRVDAIGVLDPPTSIELEAREIGHLELLMISSKAGLAVGDLASIDHIFVDWGTVFNAQQAQYFRESRAPALHTSQSQIALEFLLSHGGVAFLPGTLVAPYLEQGLLHHVANSASVIQEVYLVFARQSAKSAQLAPIITVLEEQGMGPDRAGEDS